MLLFQAVGYADWSSWNRTSTSGAPGVEGALSCSSAAGTPVVSSPKKRESSAHGLGGGFCVWPIQDPQPAQADCLDGQHTTPPASSHYLVNPVHPLGTVHPPPFVVVDPHRVPARPG